MVVAAMEKVPLRLAISFSIMAIFTLASFASSMAAEFNRATKKELKLSGRLCYMPESEAFKLGIAGLVCLIMAHIIGNSTIIFHTYYYFPNHNQKTRPLNTPLLIAWVSFGIGLGMMSGGSSMSRRQDYGKGWMEGECYVVKDGVFVGAALLALINGASILTSAAAAIPTKTPNQIQHAQIG